MALRQYGPVIPGRYNWDAQGNVSTETGFWLFNFYAVLQARQQQQGGGIASVVLNTSNGPMGLLGLNRA